MNDYQKKRENFIAKARSHFGYLVDCFAYDEPVHEESVQPNGSVTRDRITYRNEKNDRVIVLENCYHPVDYGFELQCHRPSVSCEREDMFMAYYVLKEDQDTGQTYLEEISREFRRHFHELISGKKWFE